MARTFNPFTNKLDNTWSWGWGTGEAPQTWTWNPNWSVISRYEWDEYVDTNTWIKYTNSTTWDTGWEVIQTAPAL